ncbi:TetR/AcrR family transcriptional regulator [Kibdelosporangium aridum]|uniref:TetR/AcrR family transcriptional regulator n=1 Tax=Kibdelosporangium aridum TaxID=2030 RepID=A0A428YVN5_KIBAR|nr:TetR/AcrR family transcriptional regulator [Kibdelosporangium aridum]RSM73871.1 TetR/AcrR family transcriptional regulator [Kibdelosporangium aridum]
MGRADKREAIMRAAMAVFGRVGYLVASIDMIAAEAGVSTRTIYNHFDSKEKLFAEVLLTSSRQVAEAHEALIDRNLTDVTDLESALVNLAEDWNRPSPQLADHFALSSRMAAEREHFPREIYEAWREAGPWRVQGALASRFEKLRDQGKLDMPDTRFAAHLLSVMVTESKDYKQIVHAFLYGYVPRRSAE